MASPENKTIIINYTNYLACRILEERVKKKIVTLNGIGLCAQGNSIESFINGKFAVISMSNEGYTY